MSAKDISIARDILTKRRDAFLSYIEEHRSQVAYHVREIDQLKVSIAEAEESASQCDEALSRL